jgi:hypothetical protein
MESDLSEPLDSFSPFVFLLLFALLLLFSGQLSRFSAPSSMLEPGNAIDRAVVEKATFINPHAVAKRDRPALVERVSCRHW